jgi:hypothetical protein
MTKIMRHFRVLLADASASNLAVFDAREIVRRAEETVASYRTDSVVKTSNDGQITIRGVQRASSTRDRVDLMRQPS